jgi:hypothetical protein
MKHHDEFMVISKGSPGLSESKEAETFTEMVGNVNDGRNIDVEPYA